MSSPNTDGFGPGVFIGILFAVGFGFLLFIAYDTGYKRAERHTKNAHYLLSPEQFAIIYPAKDTDQ